MFGDDDAPIPHSRLTPLALDRLGIEELEAYVGALRTEIDRAQAEIGRKQNVRSAADGVFNFGS